MNALLEDDDGYGLPSQKLSDYSTHNMMGEPNDDSQSVVYCDTTVLSIEFCRQNSRHLTDTVLC